MAEKSCSSVKAWVCTLSIVGCEEILYVLLDILFAHFNSTVDYMVSDLDLFSLSAFTVKPLTPLSDHSQITVFLKRTNNTTPPQPSKLFNIKKSCRWAENSTEEFQKALSTPEIQTLLDTFLDTTYVHRKRWCRPQTNHNWNNPKINLRIPKMTTGLMKNVKKIRQSKTQRSRKCGLAPSGSFNPAGSNWERKHAGDPPPFFKSCLSPLEKWL